MSLSPNLSPVPSPTATTPKWTAPATGALLVAPTATLAVTDAAIVVTSLTAPSLIVTESPALVVYAAAPHLPTIKGSFTAVSVYAARVSCGYSAPGTTPPTGEPLVAWEARCGAAAAIFFEHAILGTIVCATCGTSFESHREWAGHTGISLPEAAYLKRTPTGLVRARLRLRQCVPVALSTKVVPPSVLAARLRFHGVDRRFAPVLAPAGDLPRADPAAVRAG